MVWNSKIFCLNYFLHSNNHSYRYFWLHVVWNKCKLLHSCRSILCYSLCKLWSD